MTPRSLILPISVLAVPLGVILLFTQTTYADNNPNPVVNYTNLNNYTGFIHRDHINLIGIQLSGTCWTLITHNITNNCLTYDKLKIFDNTNQHFSGKWIKTPYWHRDKPMVKDFYNFASNKFVVYVDPDKDFTTRAKMIIINENNFTYINHDDNATNKKFITHVNRSVLACEDATVAPNLWLINDTIKYLESGCTKTSYNDTQINIRHETPFDMNTYWFHTTTWYKQAKTVIENCITKKCNVPGDPNHTHDTKFGW